MSTDIRVLADIVFSGTKLTVRTIEVHPRNGDPSRTFFFVVRLYTLLPPQQQRHTEEGYEQVRDFAAVLVQAVARDGWHGEKLSLEEASRRIASVAKATRLITEEREEELYEYLLTQLRWLQGCGLL